MKTNLSVFSFDFRFGESLYLNPNCARYIALSGYKSIGIHNLDFHFEKGGG
jgi:hypothetical protein